MSKIVALLSRRERTQLPLVLLVLLLMAGVEVIGVAAVAGFIALVTDTTAVTNNRWVGWLYRLTGEPDHADFVLLAGIGLFGVIVFRNAYSAFAVWIRLRFLHYTRRSVANRLLRSYLARPYTFFQRANSATLIKNLTYEVPQLVNGYLLAWLMLIADSVTAIAVVGLLLWNDPLISLGALGLLAAVGGLFLFVARAPLTRLGRDARHHNQGIYKAASEAIGGIKELKVFGRENYFVRTFSKATLSFVRKQIAAQMVREAPRFGLEVLVFGAILLIVLLTLKHTGDVSQVAGTVALFIAAFYRLVPTLHRIVNSVSGLSFNRAIVDDLSDAVGRSRELVSDMAAPVRRLCFRRSIRLRGVRFGYEGGTDDILKGIDVEIPYQHSVAFVGATGVGKTTLVDIVLGLLEPTAGAVEVDGVKIDRANARDWRASVGYVPQSIYLADDTIRRNIALGVDDDAIDERRVVEAARAACLDEFIDTLPDGYTTAIGERGIRLSGGQRQRVGIARALYNPIDVLVLDEATSSLDGVTEAIVEDAVRQLADRLTIIIVAHRLSTVRHCDTIYLMQDGCIAASGSHAELLQSSDTFKAMARVTG